MRQRADAERVVITGLGAVTPIGNTVDEFWNAIRSGKSGVGPITKFDASQFTTRIAAEVKNFDPLTYMDRRDARKMDNFSQFAVAAAVEAARDAGLTDGGVDPERLGCILGIGIGGFETIESSYYNLIQKGPSRVAPMTIPKLIANIAPGNIAILLNAQGPCYSLVTACASGTDALGDAARLLRAGELDVVISGGVEACITQLGVAGFNVIQALSTGYNDRPEVASRPFDKDRDGFVLGEGAGVIVLERLGHARKRGAPIYAELVGYGITCDANHLTAPHPEGIGAIRAMRMALTDGGLAPEEVDYVNAHGTSTPMNDPIETMAIKQVFGEHAYRLKVSSTKSMTGHCIGAAGGVEALACVLAIRDQFFPPTTNLNEPDPECDLDYVANTGVPGEVRVTISNSLGFGGHNGVVAIAQYRE